MAFSDKILNKFKITSSYQTPPIIQIKKKHGCFISWGLVNWWATFNRKLLLLLPSSVVMVIICTEHTRSRNMEATLEKSYAEEAETVETNSCRFKWNVMSVFMKTNLKKDWSNIREWSRKSYKQMALMIKNLMKLKFLTFLTCSSKKLEKIIK